MTEMICRGCGMAVAAGVSFCPNCGIRVSRASAEATAQTAPVSVGAEANGLGETATQPIPSAQPEAAVATAPVPVAGPAAQHYTEELGVPPMAAGHPADNRRRFVLAVVAGLLLTLIARGAFAAMTYEPDPPGELVAELPVGREGGSATFGEGGKINVPKGALTKPQTITVRRTVVRERIRALSAQGGPSIVVPPGTIFAYWFGPTDIAFLRAVTIVLPAPSPPAQGLVFVLANGRITFVQGKRRGGQISIQVKSLNFARGPQVFVNRR